MVICCNAKLKMTINNFNLTFLWIKLTLKFSKKHKILVQVFLIHFEAEWHLLPGLMGVVVKIYLFI